jgi:PAS domain S-box-containing protein
MSELDLAAVMPTKLVVVLIAGALVPALLAVLLLARYGRRVGLATRLSLAAFGLFGIGVGLMAYWATLAVLRVGLRERHAQFLPVAVEAARDLDSLWQTNRKTGMAPRLALLRSANPGVGFAAVLRLRCRTDCVVATDAERAELHAVLARAAQPGTGDDAGNERGMLLGGRLYSIVTSAIRDPSGLPVGVLLLGASAEEAARAAQRTAWLLVATAWGLLILMSAGAHGIVAASVTRRVRILTARLERPSGQPADERPGDELAALSLALDEAIGRSLERDRAHSARYRELVDNAPYGICRVDRDHRITAANPALARLMGVEPLTDLKGRDIRDWFDSPRDAAMLLARCGADSGVDPALRMEPAEWAWRAADGSPRIVRIACLGVADGVELIIEDVTERRTLEAQLQQAQKMEALGRLTGGIAQDFNNLLTVIVGNITLIRERLAGTAAPVADELRSIEGAAGRGAAFIRKLLVFSRMDPLERRPVPVSEVVHGAGFLLRRILPDDIRISIPASAPEASIVVDVVQVEQMLLNLATNARDAMPNGGELALNIARENVDSASARRLGLPSPGSYVVLTMRDTGDGIPAEIRAHVFDPFFTTRTSGGRSGLGLSIVYGLMKRHGGAVRLHPAEGPRGTTMSLYFPEHDESVAPVIAGPSQVPVPGPDPRRLLLVEDDYEVQRLTKKLLERRGYVVDVARDGQEGLAMLLSEPPYALVLADVVMPNMSGPDLLNTARAAGLETPFVFVSGYSMDDLDAVVRQDGRTRLLTKPWTPQRLFALLSELLDAPASAGAPLK